jgi:hypothetical protein
MWKRIAVYSALAACAGLVAWLQFRSAVGTRDPGNRPAAATARAAPDTTGDPYRLQPDVRVLEAAGDLHRLITGGPAEDARADFAEGRWTLTHRGVTVGTLPEFPEFGDLERLLSNWAVSLGLGESLAVARSRAVAHPRAAQHAAIATRLGRLEATAAADYADRLWSAGRREPELLRLAAHALVLLGVQTVDEVGGADRVTARALALVAACEALDPGARARAGARARPRAEDGASAPGAAAATPGDAALLADLMGYATAARERAAALDRDDPVRLFVLHEDERLEKRAGRKSGTAEARFLALLRIARRHDFDRWQAWKDRHFPGDPALALTCTSLEIGRFDAHLPAAIQVLSGVLQDLRMIGEVGDEEDLPESMGSLAELIREFERLMVAMRPKADGAFLDADVLRAHYRTCFYSALTILGEHLRQSLSSLPDTRAFASDLGAGDEGVAGEFQRWYTHLANAKAGKPELAALRKDLMTMPHFGAPLLLRTYQAIQASSPSDDLGLRTTARRIAKSLDTRPEDLLAFAVIVHQSVLDLDRAESLYARGIGSRGAEEPRLRSWWARYNRDADALESMLETPELSPAEQADVLENLAAIPGVDSSAVESDWERCLRSNRKSWEVLDGYTRFLRSRGRYGKARAELERWLDRAAERAAPFEEIFARTRLARNYSDQGENEKAIEVIEPMVESQQFGAMDCMVELLEKTGQLARAETLAVFAWGRYPDSPNAQARVVELCWRQGKVELAARMLAAAPVPLSAHDFRGALAQGFIGCFRASPAKGVRAIEAILASGSAAPAALMALAAELDEAGEHRLAYEVQSRIPAQGPQAVANLARSYHYMRRWKGEDAALDWLRPRLKALGPRDQAMLSYVGYESRDYDLLWEIDDVGPEREHSDFHWLMRAAAAARPGGARGARREKLARHFARPRPEHYAILGRFMLGLEDEQAALASVTDPRSRCETDYYLGLRAQSRGAIRDAARWYARCVEGGQSYNFEYHWAHQQLYEWVAGNTSLARLEADAKHARLSAYAP